MFCITGCSCFLILLSICSASLAALCSYYCDRFPRSNQLCDALQPVTTIPECGPHEWATSWKALSEGSHSGIQRGSECSVTPSQCDSHLSALCVLCFAAGWRLLCYMNGCRVAKPWCKSCKYKLLMIHFIAYDLNGATECTVLTCYMHNSKCE
jgi:hypothetical protein